MVDVDVEDVWFGRAVTLEHNTGQESTVTPLSKRK